MVGLKSVSSISRHPGARFEGGCTPLALLCMVLVMAGCSLFASPRAEPGDANLAPGEPALRIATSGDYPPFSDWPDTKGAPTGFSIDVARAYAAATGRRTEWVPFGWPELAVGLEAGRFDLALSGVTVRADRSITGRFSIPLTTSGAVLLVPETSRLRTPADLGQGAPRIAVNAGGHLERIARRLFPGARIEPVSSNDRVLARLGEGKGIDEEGVADAVLTDTLEAPLWQAARPGLRAIGPLTRDRKAAWAPIAAFSEIERFDAWLLEAERSGLLAALRERHGLPATRTASPRAALLARLDERLSLMQSVAASKAAMGTPVEDPAREARVLDAAVRSVARAARSANTSPPHEEAIRALYRAQIEAAKWIQRDWLSAQDGAGTIDRKARERLDEEIRPALIHLGDRIAWLLVRSAETPSPNAPITLEEMRDALSRHGLPAPYLEAIARALRDVYAWEAP